MINSYQFDYEFYQGSEKKVNLNKIGKYNGAALAVQVENSWPQPRLSLIIRLHGNTLFSGYVIVNFFLNIVRNNTRNKIKISAYSLF